jgi:hypothetical protein
MSPFLRDTALHFGIEEVATLFAVGIAWAWRHRCCGHRWNRWARLAVQVGAVLVSDFILAAVCVKVIG